MKPKVAFVCEQRWCMGRISEAVKKYLEPWYDVVLIDGSDLNSTISFFKNGWKDYDIITGNSQLDYDLVRLNLISSYTPEFLNKCVVTIHCPIFDHKHFTERITHKDGPLWTGITEQVVDNIRDKYGVNAGLTPIGVDPDHFYPTREIETLRRAGWVGKPNGPKQYIEIKRPEMFDEICRLSGLEPVYLHGKDFRLNNKLYEDIDILIVTSTVEGIATSIAEAGTCDIPVIATKVGYAKYLKNIKTFETVDEAVELIKTLDVPHYAKTLGEEIRSEWNWKTICERYWKPVFDKRLIGSKPKVAVIGYMSWCMGRINTALKKYLDPWYDVTLYDWSNQQHLMELFTGDMKWKDYDIITGNSGLDEVFTTNGCLSAYTSEFLNKCVFTIHCPLFDHPVFTERITHKDGPLWTGITEQVVDNIRDKYGVNAGLTPIGVDPDHFYPTREIETLRRAGWVGKPNGPKQYIEIKRPEMFDEICRLSGLEPVYLHGKDFRLNNKLYEDIDILIVTSTVEGIATSIAEAGTCDIPVIATKVGYAKYLKNIKTFETVDEAVELINTLDVPHYAKTLGEEIRSEWNWKTICERYWKPVFDRRLCRRKLVINTHINQKYQRAVRELLVTLPDVDMIIAVGGCDKDELPYRSNMYGKDATIVKMKISNFDFNGFIALNRYKNDPLVKASEYVYIHDTCTADETFFEKFTGLDIQADTGYYTNYQDSSYGNASFVCAFSSTLVDMYKDNFEKFLLTKQEAISIERGEDVIGMKSICKFGKRRSLGSRTGELSIYRYGESRRRWKHYYPNLGIYKYVTSLGELGTYPKYGLISYSRGCNLGDDIQSLAAEHLLAKHYNGNVIFFNNLEMNRYRGPPIIVIVNGYIYNNPVPSPDIIPVFVGVHFVSEDYVRHNMEYYKKHGPIGCRDQYTYDICKRLGIDAYLSYCLTLGFDKYTGTRGDAIVNNDVNRSEENDCMQIVTDKSIWNDRQSRRKMALQLLDTYKKAKHVNTARLHCYLPCLAFGTPCSLIYDHRYEDVRFTGYDKLPDDIYEHVHQSFERWAIQPYN